MRIITDGNISPRTILLDSPSRLVLDLIGAELKSKLQEKTFTVGDEQIRVAQFDTSIVRIVFTGPKSHQREVRISDNERQLLVLGEGSKQKQVVENFNKLLAIKISKTDAKETTYQIDAEKKLNYKFIKLHDPERLVIDFVDTKLTDAFGSNLVSETGHVSGLRYGLATLGRPVTRMVIDLKSKNYTEEFKESPTGTQLFIRILGAGQGISSTNPEADKDPNAVPGENKVNGSKVVIDPGHGGYDHGAIYGGHNEKDINLAVASKVEALLKEAGVAAFMTRAEDRFISLAERVEISNNIDPDIFVSLHSNAVVSNPKMAGLQTYFFSDGGYKLAQFTHKQMVDDVGMPDGKIRKANFWVCKYSKSPAVLIEMGFMTNSEEREKLASDRYQADLAKAITKGIIKYLEENS
ncbi:MAG: N-acetylmuramoyl-L-alanine amidase [Candidatus Caenarcaniphilales bacterium]|jgi:N-acetylmuramoyl-L-alanine amidase|nr:N-acetylmuramoyl-L-alanine amidase [Candidatus Caenarcaniphilales bacterium]